MLQELLTSRVVRFTMRNLIPKQMRHTFWQRRGWICRVDKEQEEKYWADASKNRAQVVDAVFRVIEDHFNDRKTIVILDYGSYVGATLRMIREGKGRFPGEIAFYAVEPGRSAFEFMKSHIDVNGLNGNDADFLVANNWPSEHINIAIVHAVFYAMSQKRVLHALQKLAKITDFLLLGDELLNLKGDKTFLGEQVDFRNQTYESLFHPWEKLLQVSGFKIIRIASAIEAVCAFSGIIVAKPQVQVSH